MHRPALLALLLTLTPTGWLVGEGPVRFVEVLEVDGAIGPGVGEYLVEALDEANQSATPPELIIITLDTPGGLVSSLREINLALLASRIPVACLVYPQGARAASAGTYMMYACHIAAMAPATTLGAATPIQMGLPQPTGDDSEEQPATPPAMEQKVLNDAIAYIRSLAQLRGRNAEWAELAVREAATLTAVEALAENVIDVMATHPDELVAAVHGRQVKTDGADITLDTRGLALREHKPDWRNRFITAITNPNIAYLLLLVGIYGLLLEFYNPGVGVGGVIGGIALLLAIYALNMMPVNFIGVALLLFGIAMMAAEAMSPSVGILGFGGVVAFVLGSIFLLDTEFQPYRVALPLIAGVTLVSALFLSVGLGLLWRARHKPVVSGQEAIVGAEVQVPHGFQGEGVVVLNGERWAAQSSERLKRGQAAVVTAIEGLMLRVQPQRETKAETDDGSDIPR